MKTAIAALSLSSILTLTGCAANETAPPASGDDTSPPAEDHSHSDAAFIAKLAELKGKNPLTDAQTAIAGGERYFLCNIGRSRTVPGLEPEVYAPASQKCPTRCLDGVTDAVLGDNHLRYLQAAFTYSASWNKVMINVCQ